MIRNILWLSLCLFFTLHLIASPSDGSGIKANLDQAEKIAEAQPEEALGILNATLQDAIRIKDPVLISRTFYLRGEAFFYLDQPDSTIANYFKAVETDIASGNDMTPEHINILGNLGYMYDQLDQTLIATDFYEKALKKAREINLKEEIASNLANIAQVKTIQGYYEEALALMQEALAIDKETGDEAIIATDLNTIGRIYESWGIYDKAVDYLEQALALDVKLGMEDKMAIRYSSLGITYNGWGKYEKALEYFNKALQIDQKLGNEDKVALRIANIGSAYIEMKQPDQAIIHLQKSLAYFSDHNMPSYIASVLNELGRSYYLKKDYRKAEEAFLQSAEICREYDYARFLMNSLDYLSKIYKETGRFDKAYGSLKEFQVMNDSIFNAETQKKLAEFNARYELDQKEQDNELLRRDNEIVKKRHMVSVLIFSLCGFFLVTVLLALLVRLKNHQNRRLVTEKENEKLKIDLEQKNKELTYNAMCIIKNNETVAKIAETLEEAIHAGEDQADLGRMVRKLQNVEREKNWSEFELRFTHVHEEFYNKLNARFPDLTPNEKKLCAFLKLNMSTKDIAAITHQSVHSINVARTRMRKKLGIDGTDENLIGFLNSL